MTVPGFALELQIEYVWVLGASTVREEFAELPLKEAVRVAVWLLVTAVVLAVNVVAELDAGTFTEAGTVTAELLLESATVVPPLGEALERVTVHELVEPHATLVGLQATDETVIAGAVIVMLAVAELPFKEAVMVADWLLEMVPAVAVKLPVLLEAATATEAGTAREELLLESATVVPPLGAALERVTVHELPAPDASVVGLQAREEIVITGATRLTDALAVVPLREAVTVAL